MTYDDWQIIFRDRFFGPHMAGLRVRLDIDRDDFPIGGGSLEDLIEAVRAEVATLPASTPRSVLELLRRRSIRYRRGLEEGFWPDTSREPLVLPALVILVLAVHHGGDDYDPNQYYRRLIDLLDHRPPADISSVAMRQAADAWQDLEDWSCHRLHGRLGLFKARTLGGMTLIGYPLRQALLAPSDVKALRAAFLREGIEPEFRVTANRLAEIARTAGLRSRVRGLLEEYPNTVPSRDLVDDIGEVLAEWTPTIADLPTADESPATVAMRLSFALRPSLPGQQAQLDSASLRVNLPSDLDPDDVECQARCSQLPSLKRILIARIDQWQQDREILALDGHGDHATPLGSGIDWFSRCTVSARLDQSKLTLTRPQKPVLYFQSIPRRFVERRASELEPGGRYLELRRGDARSDRPSIGAGTFDGETWLPLGGIDDVYGRAFSYVPTSANDTAAPRLVLEGGIRTRPGAREFFDFALPTIVASEQSPTSEGTVEEFEITLHHQGGAEPTTRTSSFGPRLEDAENDPFEVGAGERRLSLQDLHDQVAADSGPVIAIGVRSTTREELSTRLLVAASTDTVSLDPPPRRSGWGELAEDGPLQGRRGPEHPPSDREAPIEAGAPLPCTNVQWKDCASPSHLRLSRLLRSRGRLNWSRERHMFQACGEPGSFGHERSVVQQALALHQLGVAELVESRDGGFETLLPLAPTLSVSTTRANLGFDARRGARSGRRYVLGGCWLPREVATLLTRCRTAFPPDSQGRQAGLVPHFVAPSHRDSLLPGRRSLIAETEVAEQRLVEFAREIGVDVSTDSSDSESSLAALDTIDEILDRLAWEPGTGVHGYQVVEFDPVSLSTSTNVGASGHRLALLECRHHERRLWAYYLVDRRHHRRARIRDRALGRWIARRAALPDVPVPFDAHGRLILPDELRLPLHLERILCMDSGVAPGRAFFRSDSGYGSSPYRRPETSSRFSIPPPPPIDVVLGRRHGAACSGRFTIYENVTTSRLCADRRVPVINCPIDRIPSTRGLE